jgi:HSP20 family protein
MTLTDLIPWGRNRPQVPTSSPARFAAGFNDERDPFTALQHDMNRLLDDFTRGFGVAAPSRAGWSTWPHLEVSETDTEVKVVAELPGIDQKDVEVSLTDGMLTLKGEKKSENSDATYSERWHGQFQRSLPVGNDVDPDKVDATFRNGVLTIAMAKRPEAERRTRRIPISAA